MGRWFWAAAGVAAMSGLAGAQQATAELRAKPVLLSEGTQVAPGGTIWLGVRFEIEKGWHIYWKGLNDTGFPPNFTWEVPKGVRVGEPLWPAPVRHINPGEILDHIYENSVTILVPVTVAADAAVGPVAIKGKAKWLVCKEACIPESAPLEVQVSVSSKPEAPSQAAKKQFDAARAELPGPLPQDGTVQAALSKQGDALIIEAPNAMSLAFFPAEQCREIDKAVVNAEGKGSRLRVPLLDEENKPPVVGIIEVRWSKDRRSCYWYDSAAKLHKDLQDKDFKKNDPSGKGQSREEPNRKPS